MKRVTIGEAFQEHCFLLERRASVGAESDLFNFQDLLHHKKKKKRITELL